MLRRDEFYQPAGHVKWWLFPLTRYLLLQPARCGKVQVRMIGTAHMSVGCRGPVERGGVGSIGVKGRDTTLIFVNNKVFHRSRGNQPP